MVERRDRRLQPLGEVVVERLFLLDRIQDTWPLAPQEADERRLPILDLRRGHLVDEPLRARVDDRHLLGEGDGLVLVLLEQLGQARPALELVARRGVEVGCELGEGRELAVLSEVEPQLARNLPHGLGLRVSTDTGDADAHVERGPLAGVEQVGLEVDLAVRDRDDVGGDEGGDVVGLGLDDRQRRQRATTVRLVHLRRTFEQA